MRTIIYQRRRQREPSQPWQDMTHQCVFTYFLDGGECEIDDINPDDLQEWIDSFDQLGAAEKAFKCLRQIIRWWTKKKRLQVSDPTMYVEVTHRNNYTPDVLDAAEVSEMLRALWGHWTEAVVICAVTLGLRRLNR